MSTIKLENIQTRTGSGTITIGASGETVEVASGVTTNLKNGATLSDNILFDTASKGIYLGVTSATASNLLDDYEEGTWTPVIRGSSTAGTYTFINSTARYIKIGKQVTAIFTCFNISQSSAGTGNLEIAGLPFAASTETSVRYLGTVGVDNFNYPSGSYVVVSISSGNSFVRLWENTASAADSIVQVTDINSGSSDLYLNLTYFID